MRRKLLQGASRVARPSLLRGSHGHVNIFENLAALNTAAAIGGFNQVITGLPTLLTPEWIDERQRLGELFGLDQKACAINVPCASRVHVVHPWGRESQFLFLV